MKKHFLLALNLIFTTIFILLSSCSDNSSNAILPNGKMVRLSQDEYISIAFDNPKEISEDQAIRIADGFGEEMKSRGTSLSPTIEKKYYINEKLLTRSSGMKSISIPIFQINLNNSGRNGFALVSADERCPCIIAYSKEGNIKDTIRNKGAEMMLKEAEVSLINNLYKYIFIRDSLRAKTLNKLSSEFGIKDIKFEQVKNRIIISNQATRSKVVPNPSTGLLWKEVKNLVTTKWNQTSPYNNALDNAKNPNALGWGYNGKNAVGCTGIAISQIVAYYEAISSVYGINLNWTKIKQDPYITQYGTDEDVKNQVANFCKYIDIGIKTLWDDDGEGAANMKNSYEFLNSIGLTFETGKKFNGFDMDAARIVESLDLGFPVFITGTAEAGTRSSNGAGNHCWILDGYQMRTRPILTRAVVKANDVYIHANFGWGGDEDGYYMVDRYTTNLTFETYLNGKFNQNLKLYTCVRRK
ncbi:MAG: C10 family peptidase [Prevotella sp.]|jgi:hypothetical protein|nr:C10 family peptidase [Prevotella sp.]MCH4216075.1 C10 family peptidase [Prevotella sp.]